MLCQTPDIDCMCVINFCVMWLQLRKSSLPFWIEVSACVSCVSNDLFLFLTRKGQQSHFKTSSFVYTVYRMSGGGKGKFVNIGIEFKRRFFFFIKYRRCEQNGFLWCQIETNPLGVTHFLCVSSLPLFCSHVMFDDMKLPLLKPATKMHCIQLSQHNAWLWQREPWGGLQLLSPHFYWALWPRLVSTNFNTNFDFAINVSWHLNLWIETKRKSHLSVYFYASWFVNSENQSHTGNVCCCKPFMSFLSSFIANFCESVLTKCLESPDSWTR